MLVGFQAATSSLGGTVREGGQGRRVCRAPVRDMRIALLKLRALRQEVTAMTQLTLELPEALVQRLAWLASEQKKSVEQVAVEQLQSLLEPAAEHLEEKYAQ